MSLSQTDVAVHKKDVHGVPYEFMCEFCGKEFIQIKSLRNHKAKCPSNPDGEEVQEKAKSVHMTQVKVSTIWGLPSFVMFCFLPEVPFPNWAAQ